MARADSRGFLLLGSVILIYDMPILSMSVVYSLVYMHVAFVAGTFCYTQGRFSSSKVANCVGAISSQCYGISLLCAIL